MLCVPDPVDVAEGLNRFVTFAWHLPDNDLSARGSARIYCDRYPLEGSNPDTVAGNASTDSAESFSWADDPDRAVIYYTYAVMNSDAYLDTFEGALYRKGNPARPPRVPLVRELTSRRPTHYPGRGDCLVVNSFDTLVPNVESLSVEWPSDFAEFRLKKFELRHSDSTIILIGVGKETNQGHRNSGWRVRSQNRWPCRLGRSGYVSGPSPIFVERFDGGMPRRCRTLIRRITHQLDLLNEVNEILHPVLSEGSGSLQEPPWIENVAQQLDLLNE